jgi:hypothetical protein
MGQCCGTCCKPGSGEISRTGELQTIQDHQNINLNEGYNPKVFKGQSEQRNDSENDGGVLRRGNSKHQSLSSGKQIDLNDPNGLKLNSHPSDRNPEKKLSQTSNVSQRINSEEQYIDGKSSFNIASTKLHLLEARKIENSLPFQDDLSRPKVDLIRAYRPNEIPEAVRFYTNEQSPLYNIRDFENYANDLPL